jgi:hypothetical protein
MREILYEILAEDVVYEATFRATENATDQIVENVTNQVNEQLKPLLESIATRGASSGTILERDESGRIEEYVQTYDDTEMHSYDDVSLGSLVGEGVDMEEVNHRFSSHLEMAKADALRQREMLTGSKKQPSRPSVKVADMVSSARETMIEQNKASRSAYDLGAGTAVDNIKPEEMNKFKQIADRVLSKSSNSTAMMQKRAIESQADAMRKRQAAILDTPVSELNKK